MKKVISIILASFLLFSSASAAKRPIKYYDVISNDNLTFPAKKMPLLENGNVVIEAEDMEYKDQAKIVPNEQASGGYVLTCTNASFVNDVSLVENVTMSLKVEVPVSEIGTYYMWLRLLTPNSSSTSFFEAYTGSSTYKARWLTVNPDFYWVKVAAINMPDGVFEYNIKYRDTGFMLDKFIITNDKDFAPSGKDDLPNAMLGIEKPAIAPPPPFTPPAGVHPRVLVQEKDLPQIKENVKHPLLSTMYRQVKERAFLEMDCHMPNKGTANNVSLAHVFNIQCRAFMYLMGEVDKNHARQTIRYMRDMYDTLIWDRSVGDITRQMGTVLAASGCVYDWCFDVLTEEDKTYFIRQMKRLASMMEIGFPAGMNETFAGHGGEGELFYFQSAAGIAIYDEDPQMYNAAAGVLYEYMFPTREFFNRGGHHPAGTAYGPVRTAWELIGQIMYERLGDPNVMGEEADNIPYSFINFRYPNGMFLEDGDTWITVPDNGPTYSSNDLAMMIYGMHFGNSYVNGEAVKQLSLRNYSAGSSVYDNGVIALLTINPDVGFTYPDDYGKEMPLTHFTSYPITTMTARTSWRSGMEGETAVVFVNGQEKLVGDHDHDHSDIGGFTIYYKGLLTSGEGTYAGSNGGWGIQHYYNYYRRSVSKNCLTIYDPDETYGITGYPLKYDLANDGGQKLEQNTDTLPEYLSHPDEAKTVGAYAGPNRQTPEFSYLKTDLTNAYSDKITGYTRSTVSLNLFNTDYPMAFICYDNVSSANPTFKKTWNLQSIETEPETVNNVTTITRYSYDYTGKLVVKTLVPEGSNAVFTNVGGEGKDSMSGGANYPNPAVAGHEAGLWRLELSPKKNSKDDIFLNAMFVTDRTKNLPDLPMTKVDTPAFVGVSVMDRIVLFSKKRDAVANTFTLNIPASEYAQTCVLVTDVAGGKWQVTGPNGSFVTEVNAEENALYARLTPGDYTFSKVDDATEAVKIDYPRDERTLRVGDVLVYDQTNKRFAYTLQPTVARDGQPYFSADDIKSYGVDITINGNQVLLQKGTQTAAMTIGSTEAVKNGFMNVSLTSAPSIDENGQLYVNPIDHTRLIGVNCSYDPFSRILRVIKMASADAFSNVVDTTKIVEPVSYNASGTDGNDVSGAFDYNYNTRWSSEGVYEYIIVDYGTKVDFDKLMIAFMEGNLRKEKFEILVSDDGLEFKEVFKGESSGTTLEVEAFPVNASGRYIKLYCHGNNLNAWNSILEVIALKK
ncbi:MAG: discoidin domain-containing protein [Clostridia bacterium]|nr:discoidin domain-containing protein [Clostridia bacterium]